MRRNQQEGGEASLPGLNLMVLAAVITDTLSDTSSACAHMQQTLCGKTRACRSLARRSVARPDLVVRVQTARRPPARHRERSSRAHSLAAQLSKPASRNCGLAASTSAGSTWALGRFETSAAHLAASRATRASPATSDPQALVGLQGSQEQAWVFRLACTAAAHPHPPRRHTTASVLEGLDSHPGAELDSPVGVGMDDPQPKISSEGGGEQAEHMPQFAPTRCTPCAQTVRRTGGLNLSPLCHAPHVHNKWGVGAGWGLKPQPWNAEGAGMQVTATDTVATFCPRCGHARVFQPGDVNTPAVEVRNVGTPARPGCDAASVVAAGGGAAECGYG
eukprot:365231-Chlamydomonas_euryale.AAC.4